MKFNQILMEESVQYEVRRIKATDNNELQKFADFYNESGQLTWKLNPQRLKSKLGSIGRLWGLYIEGTDQMVGTIGIKEIEDELGEIGYLMIDPAHRSFPNLMSLYKSAFKYSRKFDSVYITTNIKNVVINKLLERTPKIEKMFKARSLFGGGTNILYVWIVRTGRENRERVTQYFGENILQEYDE